MDQDLERAGPSIDTQRSEVHARGAGNPPTTTTTPGDDQAVVDAWMHRLQMLTVVTTFLASIDGELFTLTNTSLKVTVSASTRSQEFVYACFAGALTFHVCATILGYTASFALIRYELVNAETGQKSNEKGELLSPTRNRHGKQSLSSPLGPTPFDSVGAFFQSPSTRLQACSRTFSAPLALISRCYYTTLVLGGAGFISAILGITAYAWEGLQRTVGIFTTTCLGVSLMACIWAVI